MIDVKEVVNHRAIRFLVVGLFNTLVGYSIFAFFIYFGAGNLSALLASTVLGVAFNYFSYGNVVFKEHRDFYVFAKFVSAYGVVYVFNATALEVLTVKFHFNSYYSQSMCVLPSVGLSWLLMSRFVFKRS